jgi:hypothetical protein
MYLLEVLCEFSKSEPGLELFEKNKSMYKISIHCPFKVNALRAHAALLPGIEK